jgi:hypothetical protein
LEKTGLLVRILTSVNKINDGRKGLDTDGGEREGRLSYKDGLSTAMQIFQEIQGSQDPEILIFVEYTFLAQELQFCDSEDSQTISSLTPAIQSFDDAFLCLKAVANPDGYQIAEMTHPHRDKYRISGLPKDSFHIACIAHRTRIQNMLRTPGINMTEKVLLQQRFVNLSTAQAMYLEKQKTALSRKAAEIFS